MSLPTRARAAVILAISLLTLSSPGALAGDSYAYQPNAEIRLGSGSYVGESVINTTAIGQSVFNTGVVDQKLTFFIRVENIGLNLDQFRVIRSGFFNPGYRVRYYDAGNNDVTGKVNNGLFVTPFMATGGEYVMRATVKIRPQATLCSYVTRLMTIRSATAPQFRDTVRFTAARATPNLNCPPVAIDDKLHITEDAVPDHVSGNVVANDIDPDGDLLSVTSTGAFGLSFGAVIINTSGVTDFTLMNLSPTVDGLNDGETLPDSFQYTISDGNGGTDIAQLLITIHGVTDFPCVVADCT